MKDPPVPSQTLASGSAGLLAALPSSPAPPPPSQIPPVGACAHPRRAGRGGGIAVAADSVREGGAEAGARGGAGAVGRAPADDAG